MIYSETHLSAVAINTHFIFYDRIDDTSIELPPTAALMYFKPMIAAQISAVQQVHIFGMLPLLSSNINREYLTYGIFVRRACLRNLAYNNGPLGIVSCTQSTVRR